MKSCFDLTTVIYDGAEICEFVKTYTLTRLAIIIKKSDCGLYRVDSLFI